MNATNTGKGSRIPFGTITITQKSKDLIMDCLERGRVSGGVLVGKLEEEMARLLAVKETVAVSSGTDALILALSSLYDFGAERGDEVILPALSYAATGHAVVHAGFHPVFVDIDPNTLNIDADKIEAAITPRTKVLLPVHLMGKPAAMDEIKAIAKKHGLTVIEDAAEAWGAEYRGRPVGSLADLGCFSLYIAHIITTADGGLVSASDERYAEVVRSLRGHGRACACKVCVSTVSGGKCAKRFADKAIGDRRFHFERIGFSSRMNDLEAALGLGYTDVYQELIEIRHKNLLACIDGFKQFAEFFQVFPEEPHEKIGPHAFPFVIKPGAPFDRDDILTYLAENGIDPRTIFAAMPTQCGGYERFGHRIGDFPHSEYVGTHGVQIGVHQDITAEDISYFLERMDAFIKSRA